MPPVGLARQEETAMSDITIAALVIGFAALSGGFVVLCDRLMGEKR
jgi:hypothetical protein